MPAKKRKAPARKRKAPARRAPAKKPAARRATTPEYKFVTDQIGGVRILKRGKLVHYVPADQVGGFNFGAFLKGARDLAKVIRPGKLVGDIMRATGADKGKVGKWVTRGADTVAQFGYARAYPAVQMYPTRQYAI